MRTGSDATARELDRRLNDGIDVRLLWHPDTGRVSVVVEDTRAGDSFELEVDSAQALDAFQHPFAYALTTNFDPALAA